jgi:hypothetical protein
MVDFLFKRTDFRDCDYARARHVGGGKDTFLRTRLGLGHVHPDGDEFE